MLQHWSLEIIYSNVEEGIRPAFWYIEKVGYPSASLPS